MVVKGLARRVFPSTGVVSPDRLPGAFVRGNHFLRAPDRYIYIYIYDASIDMSHTLLVKMDAIPFTLATGGLWANEQREDLGPRCVAG